MKAHEQRRRRARSAWTVRALCAAGVALGGLVLAAGTPRPPVFPAVDLGFEQLDAGELLLGELNCTACHAAEPAVAARLLPHPAPALSEVAGRIQPSYLRTWLLDPLSAKPGTPMPDVLRRLPLAERAAAATELTHFLASLPGATTPPAAPRSGPLPVQQGRVLYHQVGCVACHAPFEDAAAVFSTTRGAPTDPDALRYTLTRLRETSQPLPDLAAKYHPGALPGFLADPLKARPGGRMPSLKLTEAESRAIAAYLSQATAGTNRAPAEAAFVPDTALARRGQARFSDLGCAACHSLTVAGAPLVSRLRAAPLAHLDPVAPDGCLAPDPAGGGPRYVLSPAQREALGSAVANAGRGTTADSPARRVTLALAAFNCVACHSRDGLGGPGPSRWDYFTTQSEADLGDEGRIPPHLSAVGNKLRPGWLGQVLTNQGVVRPYLAVRMPQYGAANVARLVTEFSAADASSEERVPAPAADPEAGRALVGVGGYSCVTCHSFGPHPSLGISVMDMTQMAKRIEWDWFRRYLLDPASLRPGTRMPAFWPEGKATVPALLDGDTERQVAAIWAYLELGVGAAPPPGLLDNPARAKAGARSDYE